MTIFQHPAVVSSLMQRKPPRPRRMRWLLVSMCIFEVFYLLLVVCTSLSALPLSGTPLAGIWPLIFSPAQFPLSVLDTLTTQHLWLAPLFLGLIFTGLIAIYIFAITKAVRTPDQETISRRCLYLLMGGALLFGVTLLFQPRLFSDDIFSSIFSGRILAVYGADPLNSAPSQFQFFSDPYLPWVITGRTTHNIYGPLWLYIATLLAGISSSPIVSLFLFKGVILLTHLLNCALIWTLLGWIAPARRLSGTLLYAWSPLALIELPGNGHNDGLLITLLLLATMLFVLQIQASKLRQGMSEAERQGEHIARFAALWSPWLLRIAVLIAFSLALSVNMITFLIAVLYIWYDLRTESNGMRIFTGFCWRLLVMLVPAFLLLLPFWRGATTFFDLTSSVDMAHFVYAPINIVAAPLRSAFIFFAGNHLPGFLQPAATADMAVRASATFIFVLIYGHHLGKIRHVGNADTGAHTFTIPGLDTLLISCSVAIFWYMILVSGWFWPWYILWMLWIVPLRRLDTFSSTILVLSCTALYIYAFVGFSRTPLATYQSALIFGVPLIYLLLVKDRQKHTERTTTVDVR